MRFEFLRGLYGGDRIPEIIHFLKILNLTINQQSKGIHNTLPQACYNSLLCIHGRFGSKVPGIAISKYFPPITYVFITDIFDFLKFFYSISKALFVLWISSFNYLGQKFFEPYENDVLNEMEERSLVSSTFTLYCALLYLEGMFVKENK